MQIGLIGLGKMGFNLALNFQRNNHDVIAFDLHKSAMERIRESGIQTASSVADLAGRLTGRRVIWIMVPSGKPGDNTIAKLSEVLGVGDIIIDESVADKNLSPCIPVGPVIPV